MRGLVVSIAVFCLVAPVSGQGVRPVREGSDCSWSVLQFEEFWGSLGSDGVKAPDVAGRLIAGISPHGSYGDAGRVYYPLFEQVSASEVVIFGVVHRPTRNKLGQPQDKLIFDSYAEWQGPYGQTRVSPLRDTIKERLDPRYVMVDDEAMCMDHSIDELLPFLQHASREARITPILVTPMSFDTMETVSAQLAGIVTGYMKENRLEAGKDICFLISADANHYGQDFNNVYFGEGIEAHRKATTHDRELINTYLEGTLSHQRQRELFRQLSGEDFKSYGHVVWCGHYTIPFGLLTADQVMRAQIPYKHLVGSLFRYGDSYTDGVLIPQATGQELVNPTSSLGHWYGYFSAGFYVR